MKHGYSMILSILVHAGLALWVFNWLNDTPEPESAKQQEPIRVTLEVVSPAKPDPETLASVSAQKAVVDVVESKTAQEPTHATHKPKTKTQIEVEVEPKIKPAPQVTIKETRKQQPNPVPTPTVSTKPDTKPDTKPKASPKPKQQPQAATAVTQAPTTPKPEARPQPAKPHTQMQMQIARQPNPKPTAVKPPAQVRHTPAAPAQTVSSRNPQHPAAATARPPRPTSSTPQTAATTANPQLENHYKSALRATIEANKRYPRRSVSRGEQGTAIISFTVIRDGAIRNPRIAQSSGESRLDQAALEAVKKSSGRHPIPAGLNRSSWEFTVPVRFAMR